MNQTEMPRYTKTSTGEPTPEFIAWRDKTRWVAERKAYEATQAAKTEAEALTAKKAATTPRTKAERRNDRANRRQLQATLRQRRRSNQATHRATKAVTTGQPQAASTHLIAAGITPTDAKRYAGAFSRGVTADSTAKTTVKLKGRRTKKVTVKLYDQATFALRLATYRPRDKAAAARFEQAAHRLAA